ncbi:MAG: triose-phosphate isomerase [Planctomycetales bacterium]|nr:triose-phosphate isomerase [Planctomycetales bacterium]
MRRPFVAGNWKMNLTRDESTALASEIVSAVGSGGNCDVAVCPPNVYLHAVAEATKGSSVGVGAQNVYHEVSGAFTGETSTEMIKDVGATYVILGHSERRNILGESNEDVNKKLHAVLAAGLTPIVCVGELLEEREAGRTIDVIKEQFTGSFANISAEQLGKCVIAYEPVWAIGTGKVATPEQAEEVHANLRSIMTEAFDASTAESVRIQYGGSVKPDNAAELLGQPNIDGALVGGAALKADSFVAIIKAAG